MPYVGGISKTEPLIVNNDHIFVDTDARDAYFTLNPDELIDQLPILIRPAEGDYTLQKYFLGDTEWKTASTIIKGRDGEVASLENVDAGAVPQKSFAPEGQFINSPLKRFTADGDLMITSGFQFLPNTANYGTGYVQSGNGPYPSFHNLYEDKYFMPALVQWDESAAIYQPFISRNTGGITKTVFQSDKTSTLDSPIQFEYITTSYSQIDKIYFHTGGAVSNLRLKIERQEGVEWEPIDYFPSEVGWNSDEGYEGPFTADTEHSIDLTGFPIRVVPSLNLRFTIEFDSGSLKGSTTEPYFAVDAQPYELRELLLKPKVYTTDSSLSITSANSYLYKDSTIVFTNTSGAVNLNIASGIFSVGDKISVKHDSLVGGSVVIAITDNTIDGASSVTLDLLDAMTIQKITATTWKIIDNYRYNDITRAAAYLSAPATVSVDANTYVPVPGTFSNVILSDFQLTADPAIQYTGIRTKFFKVDFYCTAQVSSPSTTMSVGIKKNGTIVTGFESSNLCKTAGEDYFVAGTAVVELATNDKIQLVIKSSSAGSITVDKYITTIYSL